MDESILVEVYISAAQVYVDAKLPISASVKEIQEILFPMLCRYSKGAFIPTADNFLYVKRLKRALHQDAFLSETGIQCGDILLII